MAQVKKVEGKVGNKPKSSRHLVAIREQKSCVRNLLQAKKVGRSVASWEQTGPNSPGVANHLQTRTQLDVLVWRCCWRCLSLCKRNSRSPPTTARSQSRDTVAQVAR